MRTRTRTLLARIERTEQAAKAQSRCSPDCICFPENEQPEFKWRAEAEIAAAVLCPLHGVRFHIVITREFYRAFRFYITDYKEGWPHQSAQYQKAMRASFDWALWPPQKEKDKEFGHDSVLILRDGTELPSGGSAIGHTPGLEKRSFVRTKPRDLWSKVIGGECEQTLPTANESATRAKWHAPESRPAFSKDHPDKRTLAELR